MNPINEPVVKAYLKTIETAVLGIRMLMKEELDTPKQSLEEWIRSNKPSPGTWGGPAADGPELPTPGTANIWAEEYSKAMKRAPLRERPLPEVFPVVPQVETVTTPPASTVDSGDLPTAHDLIRRGTEVITDIDVDSWLKLDTKVRGKACQWAKDCNDYLKNKPALKAYVCNKFGAWRGAAVVVAQSQTHAAALLNQEFDREGVMPNMVTANDMAEVLRMAPQAIILCDWEAPDDRMGVYTCRVELRYTKVQPIYVVVAENAETAADLVNKRLGVAEIDAVVSPDQMTLILQRHHQVIPL